MSGNPKNRWLIAASAVGIHISIGSVYAYSVMKKPVEGLLGWTSDEVLLAFSVAIVFLGLSSAFLGFLVDKKGPRFSGRISAICYGLGIIGTGLSMQIDSYPLFIASYGVIGGVGLGLGYITPVTTLMKWFPDRRGLATGMAIMGFGFAALIFGPTMEYLFEAIDLPMTFYLLGSIYFILIFSSASYLEAPPEGWKPNGLTDPEVAAKKQDDLSDSTANEAIKTGRFWLLWIMLFINITCGIGIISVASPMAQEVTGMSAMAAAVVVGMMGLFNGLGRIVWASFSDFIGRPMTYATFFILQIAAFLLIVQIEGELMFKVLLFLILSCYGGGFATVPAFLGDLFGTKEVGTIHGRLLTAWSAAGIAGPYIIEGLKKSTEGYAASMQVFAILFGVALVATALLYVNMRSIRAKKATATSS